jgi:hypothetical protein
MAVDPLLWADERLRLSDGINYTLKGRPYLLGMVNCPKRVMSSRKGAQVGVTMSKYVEALHGCFFRKYKQNIIYMLPTVKQAEMLSKVAFDPIFRFNGWLKKHVSVDSASIKTVNGRSIVFVGAQSQQVGDSNTKDSVNLRSIAADVVYRDELDMMDPDMVELSKQRLNASEFRIECDFASPTISDYGIDLRYMAGDQSKWQIKCRSCNKYTCLGETWPRCVGIRNGNYYRCCVHCQREIYVEDGEWVAERESREASFWVDGIMAPTADLEGYLRRYDAADGRKIAEFTRSILGLPYDESDCQLTPSDVVQCCSNNTMQVYSSMPTCMGIDVGEKMHVVVGHKTGNNTYRVLLATPASSFGELHAIAERMNVQSCVIDKGPDIHAPKEFRLEERFPVFRCYYSEFIKEPKWDNKTGVVTVNRNEWCDNIHSTVLEKRLVLPRNTPEIEKLALNLTKMSRQTVSHPKTGVPVTKWVKRGDKEDHYFHALLYFMLAAERTVPVREGAPTQRYTSAKCRHYI